jgi:phosphatidylglycerophosphate synthase
MKDISTSSHIPLRDKIESLPTFHKMMACIGEKVHPNQITAVRIPMAIGALGLQTVSPVASTAVAAITDCIDWLDGAVARASNKTTMEGARFDPYVDKVVNTLELVYLIFSTRSFVFALSALENIAIDIYSQKQRGSLLRQLQEGIRSVRNPESCTPDGEEHLHLKANRYGKYKKILQSVAIIVALLDSQNNYVQLSSAVLLNISFVLGYMGTKKRLQMVSGNVEE